MGRWFVPGSRHYSWDKVKNILYNVPDSRHYSWDKVKNILYNVPGSRHYSWDKVKNISYNVSSILYKNIYKYGKLFQTLIVI